MGAWILAGIAGLFLGFIAFLLLVLLALRLAENVISPVADILAVVIPIILSLGVAVLLTIVIYNNDRGQDPYKLQLKNGTIYEEGVNNVETINDSSTKSHPNRFTVTYLDDGKVEVSRDVVKVIVFEDKTELKLDN